MIGKPNLSRVVVNSLVLYKNETLAYTGDVRLYIESDVCFYGDGDTDSIVGNAVSFRTFGRFHV